MAKQFWVTFSAALIVTVFISIFWHVVLFEQAYLELGVYTRMDDPIYGFGLMAWLMESAAFVAIYLRTSWARGGMAGALMFAGLMAVFIAASSLMGAAAKIAITDLGRWFMLSGGFIALHFLLLGVTVELVNRRRAAFGSFADPEAP